MNYNPFYEVLPRRSSPSSYIGLTKEEALVAAKKEGWIMHIAVEDGVSFPCSASLCYHRFEAYVRSGIVTSTGVIG